MVLTIVVSCCSVPSCTSINRVETKGSDTSEISYALPEIDFEIMKSKAC